MTEEILHDRRKTDRLQPCPMSGAVEQSAQSAAQHCKQMTGISEIEDRLDCHAEQLSEGNERMGRMEEKLDANNSATDEVLEILKLGKAFFKLADYFGIVIKWGLGISTAFLAFWLTLKGGKQ